jgi:uncharacterized protein YjiS (DUF1127 family)
MEIAMLGYIKSLRGQARVTREINFLGDNVLEDLGVTRSGLRRIIKTPQAVLRRMTAMAGRQRVEQPTLMRDLQKLPVMIERCCDCQHTRACASFLETPSADAGQAAFCPNLGEFKRMARANEHA